MIVLPFTKNTDKFKIGILIKESAVSKEHLLRYYIDPLQLLGIPPSDIVVIGLKYADNNKISASVGKEHGKKVLLTCQTLKITTIIVADSTYYKFFTGFNTKNKIGAVEPVTLTKGCVIKAILGINYQALFYNDRAKEQLTASLTTLKNFINHSQTKLGTNIINNSWYPKTSAQVKDMFFNLHRYGALTCDIETTGLRFNKHILATIAFGMDKCSGTAFNISHGSCKNTQLVKKELVKFFRTYKGQLIFHNALFDVKFLIFHLFMHGPKDYLGMSEGLAIFSNAHCTQVLTFIATNSTGGNKLGLKENALEFTGDYAKDDIKNVTLIDTDELLEYNLIDCLATWYLIDKYDHVLADPKLFSFYKTIAQPSLMPTIKMMLIGLPMDMEAVKQAKIKFKHINLQARNYLSSQPEILQAEAAINYAAMVAKNKTLKKKVKPLSDFTEVFNTGSPTQLAVLLYDVMGLPVLDWTKTKLRGTGSKTINKLQAQVVSPQQGKILEALIDISQTDILLNNFIKNFEELAFYKRGKKDAWLNGNLKTTGTQSGRYSSSEPNMQNMPSTSKYAKDMKKCFKAPEGWVIGGADFSSLEDRINAILTQDPNKIKVYTDGYDGHSLRAYAYFMQDMVGITNTVASINSIADKYPDLRQQSKGPTFALTYEGTAYTLVKNLGLSQDAAEAIEKQYHALYKVSDEFSQRNILQASKSGYVSLAFGAKLFTPVLRQALMHNSKTPREAQAEGRSANNAITQSWGMLTNRAVIDFEQHLSAKPSYVSKVLICNVIHDAIYILIKKEPAVIKWVNETLIKCMQWNDIIDIKSTDVPMEAELEIGKDLSNQIPVPNNASYDTIKGLLNDIAY